MNRGKNLCQSMDIGYHNDSEANYHLAIQDPIYNQLSGPPLGYEYFIWPSPDPGLSGILSEIMSDGASYSELLPDENSNYINDEHAPSNFVTIYGQEPAYPDIGDDNYSNVLNQSFNAAEEVASSLAPPQTHFPNFESVGYSESDNRNFYSPGPSSSLNSRYQIL
jgi:hypothetical protein